MDLLFPLPHCWFLRVSTMWFLNQSTWYFSFRFSLKRNIEIFQKENIRGILTNITYELGPIQHCICQPGSDPMGVQFLSFKQTETFLGEQCHQSLVSGPASPASQPQLNPYKVKMAKMDVRAFLRLLWLRSQVMS